jgi:hypothetical protein
MASRILIRSLTKWKNATASEICAIGENWTKKMKKVKAAVSTKRIL